MEEAPEPRYAFPAIERSADGEEVPMPRRPLLRMVSAAGELVAYASVLVPIYRLPPCEEKSQCLRLAVAPESERTRFLPVVVASWRVANGVVVPTPMRPLVVKFPFDVVVALPPTQRLLEMERLVVEALTKVETPVTESVPVAVMLAAERLPEKRPLPWTERSCEGEVVPMPTEPPRNCAA